MKLNGMDFADLAKRYPNIANPRTSTRESAKTNDARKAAVKAAVVNSQELKRELGSRYADCTLEEFIISGEAADRQKQLAQLTAYRDTLKERVIEGSGVFLFGPAGCGKDHLLSALMLDEGPLAKG